MYNNVNMPIRFDIPIIITFEIHFKNHLFTYTQFLYLHHLHIHHSCNLQIFLIHHPKNLLEISSTILYHQSPPPTFYTSSTIVKLLLSSTL